MEPDEAFKKLAKWCVYQERLPQQAHSKLLQWGVSGKPATVIVAELTAQNFLNAERFAIAYARGKFRIKYWGRQKIKTELKKLGVSNDCIARALALINNDEYEAAMKRVIEKKRVSLNYNDNKKLFRSVWKHTVSKGYESDMVTLELTNLIEEYNNEY